MLDFHLILGRYDKKKMCVAFLIDNSQRAGVYILLVYSLVYICIWGSMCMGRGEEKNQGEGHIFKAEIFQIAYLTTCTSASGGKSPDPPLW